MASSIRQQLMGFTRREQFAEISFFDMDCAKNTDIEEDAPVLYALVEYLEPKRILELGTRHGISTEVIAAAMPEGSLFVTVDPEDCSRYVQGLKVHHAVTTGEKFYEAPMEPVDFLFIDTDPHTFEQTMGWLTTYVEHKLARKGVVAFHDVHPAREEIRVREAVEAWLATKKGWRWQVLLPERAMPIFNGGLGILWAP